MILAALARYCLDGVCADTKCAKDGRCAVFDTEDQCKAACRALCYKHETEVENELAKQTFYYRCALLDTGKIVAIAFSVCIVCLFIILDVFLLWYCYKRSDDNGVLSDTEIGGMRRFDAVKRLYNVRVQIELAIDEDIEAYLVRISEMERIRAEWRSYCIPAAVDDMRN